MTATRSEEPDYLSALLDVKVHVFGEQRRPLPLAVGSVASALIILITSPLTSIVVFAAILAFLVLAVFLVLVADSELARRGAESLPAGVDLD